MILTLEEAKEYLRIEPDYIEEDALITGLVSAAEAYIKNATGNTFDGTNDIAKLVVKILVTHWYENRNAVVVGSVSKKLELTIDSLMLQLQYCYSPEVVL